MKIKKKTHLFLKISGSNLTIDDSVGHSRILISIFTLMNEISTQNY